MYQIVQQLIQYTNSIYNRHQTAREGRVFSFYEDIVPFAEEMDHLISKLNADAAYVLALPYMNKMKYDILIDNLKTLSVQCHDPETSKKIFMDKLKSVRYDLNYIKESETQYG